MIETPPPRAGVRPWVPTGRWGSGHTPRDPHPTTPALHAQPWIMSQSGKQYANMPRPHRADGAEQHRRAQSRRRAQFRPQLRRPHTCRRTADCGFWTLTGANEQRFVIGASDWGKYRFFAALPSCTRTHVSYLLSVKLSAVAAGPACSAALLVPKQSLWLLFVFVFFLFSRAPTLPALILPRFRSPGGLVAAPEFVVSIFFQIAFGKWLRPTLHLFFMSPPLRADIREELGWGQGWGGGSLESG